MNKSNDEPLRYGCSRFCAISLRKSPNSNRRQTNSNTTPVSSGPATGISPSKGNWNYSETEDQVARGKIHVASIESSNTIALDFPYSENNMELWFYVNTRSTAKTFILESNVDNCSIMNTTVLFL